MWASADAAGRWSGQAPGWFAVGAANRHSLGPARRRYDRALLGVQDVEREA